MLAKIGLAILSLLKVIARPIIDALIYMKGVAYGQLKSEADRLAEQQARVERAKRAKEEADADDTPDPYLRD